MCGVYPDADAKPAGEEISSIYEGRHVTLKANELIHGSAVAVVTKGLPVSFGNAVGIALKTEGAETDLIAVDTEGIWVIDVTAEDDGGNSAIVPGDKLYFNTTTGVVSKIASTPLYGDEVSLPLGYALGSIDEGVTATIAVKLHWDRTNSLLDAETIYFGDDKDIAIYFTGTKLNIITGSGGGGQLVELQGLLTVAGTFTCNAAGVFGGSVTAGSMISNGNMGIGGQLTIASTVKITNPPTSDPGVPGVLWVDGVTIKRSAG